MVQVSPCAVDKVEPAKLNTTNTWKNGKFQATNLRGQSIWKRVRKLQWKHKLSFGVLLVIWSVTVLVVMSQTLGVVWKESHSKSEIQIGVAPDGTGKDKYFADGANDDPFIDRLIACVPNGRVYEAQVIKNALARAIVVDYPQNDAYRLLNRTSVLAETTPETLKHYDYQCQVLSATIDRILNACSSFGFNVTNDNLRVINGVDGDQVLEITGALPIVIMPYWDNGLEARLVVPGQDGVGCGIRLLGEYLDPTGQHVDPMIRIVARSKVTKQTQELLKLDGEWRNGWFETADNQKWYSFLQSSVINDPFGLADAVWNLTNGSAAPYYVPEGTVSTWGDQITVITTEEWFTSIVVSNGTRYGLFWYNAEYATTVRMDYTWQNFVSNMTLMALLFRWLIASIALCVGYLRGDCEWSTPQIGCLANAHSFTMLPVFFLPHLRVILAVFWSSGLFYEGDMYTFTNTWYIMYSSLAEFVFLLFSVINFLSRCLCIRVNDSLFAPTFLFLCGLHYFRQQIGFGNDGRVTTVMTNERMQTLSVYDFLFTAGTNFDFCGRVTPVYAIKLAVIGVNFAFAFLWFPKFTHFRMGKYAKHKQLVVEQKLALCAGYFGGLGMSNLYARNGELLLGYELVRFGYVVYGEKYLVPMSEWYMIVWTRVAGVSSYRVLVYALTNNAQECSTIESIQHMRLRDPRLQAIRLYQVSCRALN